MQKFQPSKQCSMGIELELQIINPKNGHLMPRAKELIRIIRNRRFSQQIKPEITQSMIEINSSVHMHAHDLLKELLKIKKFMNRLADKLNIHFSGGGTHPFQMWKDRKIFPTLRFKNLLRRQGYLAKKFTVFGQHIHVGCSQADDAIYLTHALSRYIPQIIALSASSPDCQGVDTEFDSSRGNIVTAFPTCGHMPFLNNWEEFSDYIKKMCNLKFIGGMKDIYWDIRPKPEFGTVEVRVGDTPLTFEKAMILSAYVQTLAHYLLQERPIQIVPIEPMIYNYNRFQAIRYGFNGDFINPYTSQHISISEDILSTVEILKSHAIHLNNDDFLSEIKVNAISKSNDAKWLREKFSTINSFKKLAFAQSNLWMNSC